MKISVYMLFLFHIITLSWIRWVCFWQMLHWLHYSVTVLGYRYCITRIVRDLFISNLENKSLMLTVLCGPAVFPPVIESPSWTLQLVQQDKPQSLLSWWPDTSTTVLNAVLKYQQLPRHISDSCQIVILPEMVHSFLYIFCRISRDDERNLNSLKFLTNFRLEFVFQATTFTFLIWDAVVISPQTAIYGSKGRHLSAYFDCIFSLGWHCFKCWKEVFIWIKLS